MILIFFLKILYIIIIIIITLLTIEEFNLFELSNNLVCAVY